MQVVLEVGPMELGLFREQYDALAAELEAEGHGVEIVEPVEYRGRLPDPGTIYDVVVHVRQAPEYAVALAAVVALLRKHLRGKIEQRRRRRGIVYLPTGETHEFDLPEE